MTYSTRSEMLDDMPVVLDIDDLSVDFETDNGTVHAVKNLSMTLKEGEIRGLVGESGSGKSVTAMTVLGLLGTSRARIRSGAVTYRGTDLLGLPRPEMQKIRGGEIGLVSQNALTALDPSYTIGASLVEVIVRHQDIGKMEARRYAIQSLERVLMPEPEKKLKAYPHQLSGGQRQRAVIAMALAAQPRLLIADEPTTALDATVQKEVLDLFAKINRELGMAMIIVTHDFGVVSHLCDSVTVMRRGDHIESGTAAQVLHSPQHAYTQGLMKAVPRLVPTPEEAVVPRSERRLFEFQGV
ncbi:ABC transporter ATP-binding protein [Brevibacterium litoralis]|uniref:ABC transporter ATP-binding protein n=1 Tax=Brevibacterium litoralis TaxID=3138935 RepID=UPI0032EF2EC9